MKKFAFSLERVLEYKRQMLGMLKNELARLRAEQKRLEGEIAAKNREFDGLSRALAARMSGGLQPHRVAAYKAYLGELNRRTNLLLEQRGQVAARAEAKQQEVVRMNSDISGLEHLRDRQLSAYRAEDRKRQEAFVEEFVSHAGARAG